MYVGGGGVGVGTTTRWRNSWDISRLCPWLASPSQMRRGFLLYKSKSPHTAGLWICTPTPIPHLHSKFTKSYRLDLL